MFMTASLRLLLAAVLCAGTLLASPASASAASASAALASAALASPALGDDDEPATALELLEPHGLETFPSLTVEALQIFLELEGAYGRGEYAECRRRLDAFWEAHPPASAAWRPSSAPDSPVFVGSPPCYYALRMLDECIDWRLAEARAEAEHEPEDGAESTTREVRLTVVLVGRGKGLEPRSWKDLERGKGKRRTARLAPELLADDHAVIRESLALFTEYVAAMTAGRLRVVTTIEHLAKLEVPLAVRAEERRHAGLGESATPLIWSALDAGTQAATDWWWVLYPSAVPEQHEDFETTEFITGGMGVGPDGLSPCFLVDDRWLLRKPPHLGQGAYTSIERRAYLPQWLQHEFFHHLFRTWPGFALEAEGHQWFDRSKWPRDFEGTYEPDYYREALHRRLRTQAEPPLHIALRYRRAGPEVWARIDVGEIAGRYVHDPTENEWHVGEIVVEGRGKRARMRWTNTAGVAWSLEPDLAAGLLRCGPDSPYADDPRAGSTDFTLVLARDAEGDWLPRVTGFRFLGDLYVRQR